MKSRLLILIINCVCVFTTCAQIIVIDPGHGYTSTGANPDGRSSTEINTALEVGLRLKTSLNNECSNWEVHMTRDIPNGWITLSQRTAMSNSWNADYFLSIHCNAGGGSGTETFWCSSGDNSSVDDIAMANQIQARMVQYGSWANRRVVEDDSYLNYHLTVLTGSSATGCLNEIGFVDFTADANKLNNSSWRDNFTLAYKTAFTTLLSNCSSTASAMPNDTCDNAVELTASSNCNYIQGTLQNVTASGLLKPSCDNFSGTPSMKDVFCYFTAASSTHTVEVDPIGTGTDAVDAVVTLYSGANCSSLTEVSCIASGAAGSTKYLYLNNLTIGQKYWIRLYDYGSVDPTFPGFQMCLTSEGNSINEKTKNQLQTLSIYPNPSKEQFFIKMLNGEKLVCDYFLIDCFGKTITKGVINEENYSVNLSEYPSSIYFLVLKTPTYSYSYKLIKQ